MNKREVSNKILDIVVSAMDLWNQEMWDIEMICDDECITLDDACEELLYVNIQKDSEEYYEDNDEIYDFEDEVRDVCMDMLKDMRSIWQINFNTAREDTIKQIDEFVDSVSEHVWRWESEVSEDLEDNAEGEIDEDLWQELNDWMLPAGWCVDFDKKGTFQRNVMELVKNSIPKLEICDEMLQEICDKDVIAYDEEEDVYCFDGYDLELASNEYLLDPFSDSIST